MHTQSYYDLIETFARPGCAICQLLLRDADRFLDGILYEFVLDSKIHQAVRSRFGLCNEHSWQLTRYKGAQLGVAILYKAALDEALTAIEQARLDPTGSPSLARRLGGNKSGAALAEQLEPTSTCLVCERVADAEKRYVLTLTKHITEQPLENAYRRSEGLCLPHFRQTLRHAHQSRHLELIVSIQTAIWRRLDAELAELIRKHDYQHAHEPKGAEMDSWARAIARLAGEKGVFGSDH